MTRGSNSPPQKPELEIDKYQNGTDKPLKYCAISLKISEMYFLPDEITENPNNFGIRVYLKNYILHKDNPRVKEAVYTHIEHLVPPLQN